MVSPSISQPRMAPHPGAADVELADVVRRFAPEYTSQYAQVMMPSQKRALSDIAACCTQELGGRLYRCDECSESFWMFHCCRNRACPKCHGRQTQQWLKRRETELLPCDYFHTVTTVPPELHGLFRRHQKFMYGLLMRVSAEALRAERSRVKSPETRDLDRLGISPNTSRIVLEIRMIYGIIPVVT